MISTKKNKSIHSTSLAVVYSKAVDRGCTNGPETFKSVCRIFLYQNVKLINSITISDIYENKVTYFNMLLHDG